MLYKVNACDGLCDRVFHLYTGVHFHEIELAVFINEELDSACIPITADLSGCTSGFTHFRTKLLIHKACRGRGFLEDLLISSLHGAVTLAQIDNVAVIICKYLNLDMLRVFYEFLDIDLVIAEAGKSFLLCGGHLRLKLIVGVNDPYAASSAAC